MRTALERFSAARGPPTFLAVLKRFEHDSRSLIGFPISGWTLALDIPAAPGSSDAARRASTSSSSEAGGRVYLTKDARLRPELSPAMYPRLDDWRATRATSTPATCCAATWTAGSTSAAPARPQSGEGTGVVKDALGRRAVGARARRHLRHRARHDAQARRPAAAPGSCSRPASPRRAKPRRPSCAPRAHRRCTRRVRRDRLRLARDLRTVPPSTASATSISCCVAFGVLGDQARAEHDRPPRSTSCRRTTPGRSR